LPDFALMENRNGLIIGAVTTRASGHAERLAALALIEPQADRPQPTRWAPTRATTPATLSWSCASRQSSSTRLRTRWETA
jgi:hypothetical protein